jgi:glycosyltransferase involved in cell wall biosynthesis
VSDAPRIVHTIARVAPADGGPSRTVTALAGALARVGADVEILTGEAGGEAESGVPIERVDVVRRGGREYPRPAALRRLLAARFSGPGPWVVHDHGIWLPSNHAVARAATRAGAFRVVSPRGMLSEWALAHRGWKKRVAWRTFQRRDLERADALHATSDLEADEIRGVGLGAPIAIVPNGVELPAPEVRRPAPGDRSRRFLFLSRLHPKKGLTDLIDAWAVARPRGWELVIAGPDEGGHRAEIERRAAALDPGPAIRFLGPVEDRDKWETYRASDVFVLPTLSENFGLVVAEALASGRPVITTRAAPWSALEERRCGWWIEPGVASLAEALRAATALDDGERDAMGERGRRLVEERFGWPAVARAMLSVYRWLAGGDRPPPCVRED